MFTSLSTATDADWQRILRANAEHEQDLPRRILGMLRELDGLTFGFAVSQLHHSLQTATMALRDRAVDEVVLCALCHDMTKVLTRMNHAETAAAILKPFVSNDAVEIVRHHEQFQSRFKAKHFDQASDLRDRYRRERWFSDAERFSEWDQAAFDPAYPVKPLDEFEPLVRSFFGKVVGK